jgi:hypothetical protein
VAEATHARTDIVAFRTVAIREDDLQRSVGRSLRSYRQERGLSQEVFGDLVGGTGPAWAAWSEASAA